MLACSEVSFWNLLICLLLAICEPSCFGHCREVVGDFIPYIFSGFDEFEVVSEVGCLAFVLVNLSAVLAHVVPDGCGKVQLSHTLTCR